MSRIRQIEAALTPEERRKLDTLRRQWAKNKAQRLALRTEIGQIIEAGERRIPPIEK